MIDFLRGLLYADRLNLSMGQQFVGSRVRSSTNKVKGLATGPCGLGFSRSAVLPLNVPQEC